MTDLIKRYLTTVEEVDGMWAEFGVFRGETFKQLVAEGERVWKFVIGVDSFCGMGEPTEHDGGHYPKGKLNAGGCQKLIKDLAEMDYHRGEYYDLFEGFVPEVLYKIDPTWIYSFVYIDFDHYLPTKQTLDFIYPKLSKGGLILFDDYVERYDILATKAIKEFINNTPNLKIEEKGIQLISGGCRTQILVRKI